MSNVSGTCQTVFSSTKSTLVASQILPVSGNTPLGAWHSLTSSSLPRKLTPDRLIPWLSFLYLVSFLDRTNIGNAKIDGLIDDLHMTNGQYNAALSLFFIS